MTLDPLFVDLYPGDGHKDYKTFCNAGPPWHGVIWKASQGTRYDYRRWLSIERESFLKAAGDRYGESLFDGFYHYLSLDVPGDLQAEFFMRTVEAVGGEKIGTLWAMIDVERGGQANQNPSPAQVEDVTKSCMARYEKITGRTATLYGGELLRSVGVKDRLGAGRSAIACYGSTLPKQLVEQTGTDLEHLLFWQYVAAESGGVAKLKGYPGTAPGCGPVDISALVLPGGLAKIRETLWAEKP